MSLDIATATAAELCRAIRDRTISSRELLETLLTRAERVNPALNAIVAWDVDRARADASAADGASARGEFAGPLHGLPMTVKDVFETAGLVTTSGATALAKHVPTADALGVARLRQAGAIIFGKSNTPEYAGDWQTYNDVYGRTNNPWDLGRTTGGSSGGAAAAVAAGLTPLEFGSDIGGSIRNPSHYNGVYGLKPSWGVVPVRGHIPGPPGNLTTVDVGVAGPLARSVADLRIALGVLAGPVPEDAAGWRLELDAGPDPAAVGTLRIATLFGEGADVVPIARDVSACLDGFARRLGAAGAVVEPAPLPVPLADAVATWRDITLPIIGSGLPDEDFAAFAELEKVAGDDPAIALGRALASRFREVLIATDVRQRQRVAWAQFFRRYDVALAPVMPTTAFPHDTDRPIAARVIDVDGVAVPHFAAAAWCCAIGVMLLPVVTLPTGLSQDGLPVGVQVIGPFLSDLRLLRIAELLDAAAGGGFRPPPAIEAP
ncbi:MAG TPA: amidase family protein [Streptosporangiaceae bacterium]|nr:amidase family protein [Streptosporangiaceae bacterium]